MSADGSGTMATGSATGSQEQRHPFPKGAMKNMKAVQVGPFSCYCLFKPGPNESRPPLGEEENYENEETLFYVSQDVEDTAVTARFRKGALVPGSIPQLTPLGGGGWNIPEFLTDDMQTVKEEAKKLFRIDEQQDLSEFNEEFLSPLTLVHYLRPHAPHHLKRTLIRRSQEERKLNCQVGEGIALAGSIRVVGFDGVGTSIIASEPCTMKQSITSYLDQVEYVCWTALDLNSPSQPSANGFIQLVDFGGGFNFTHFLDPRPLSQLGQMWESQFRRRTKAFLIVEMPTAFRTFLSVFMQMSKQGTRNKIQFLETPEEAVRELKQLGCDQETLTRIQNYMNDRRLKGPQTWHPIIDLPFFRERLANLRLDQDTPYLSAGAHRRLRETIQDFRINTWGPPLRPSQERIPSRSFSRDVDAAAASTNQLSPPRANAPPASSPSDASSSTPDTSGLGKRVPGPSSSEKLMGMVPMEKPTPTMSAPPSVDIPTLPIGNRSSRQPAPDRSVSEPSPATGQATRNSSGDDSQQPVAAKATSEGRANPPSLSDLSFEDQPGDLPYSMSIDMTPCGGVAADRTPWSHWSLDDSSRNGTINTTGAGSPMLETLRETQQEYEGRVSQWSKKSTKLSDPNVKGCGAGVARLLQRVLCCAVPDGKSTKP